MHIRVYRNVNSWYSKICFTLKLVLQALLCVGSEFVIAFICSMQGPWTRCHDTGWWTASAEQWGVRSVPDASYSQPDCSRNDLPGLSTFCTPWSGNQELPGGKWTSRKNRGLWHVQRHLQHRLLQGEKWLHSHSDKMYLDIFILLLKKGVWMLLLILGKKDDQRLKKIRFTPKASSKTKLTLDCLQSKL